LPKALSPVPESDRERATSPPHGTTEDSQRGGDVKLRAVREGASHLRRRSGGERTRARLIISASALVIGLATWAVWEIPAKGTLLRQSFTRLPDRYTELYFSSPPTVNSGIVTVPIALIDHGDHSMLQLRTLVRDGSGRVTSQITTAVQPHRDVPVTFAVHLPEAAGQSQVQVDLLDHPQTLHYRLGSPAA
jgi:hypothetical protein